MSDNKDIITYLRALDLTHDESLLYLELLKAPRSHLELSRATGINRTKVYRIADTLEKRSLASVQTDDSGSLLVASDPASLEIELVTKEERLKNQRAALQRAVPALNQMQVNGLETPGRFSVKSYDGVEGFKQMLWHELKAKGEILIFGSGALEDLVNSVRWSEEHRSRSLGAGYSIRELLNPDTKPETFTKNKDFLKTYNKRELSPDVLLMQHQVSIYNDTVATYCWRDGQKVGVEVINKANAQMMRQIFEQYWNLAK